MKKRFVDRSRIETTQRCKRARFLEYESGASARGIVPVRKSIHLVLGGAVHSGLEVLLREAQAELSLSMDEPNATIENVITHMFEFTVNGETIMRRIENEAVAAALADLTASTTFGVELDSQEQGSGNGGGNGLDRQGAGGADGIAGDRGANRTANFVEDSPITVSFDDADLKEFYATKTPNASFAIAESGVDRSDALGTASANVWGSTASSHLDHAGDDFATPRYTQTAQTRAMEEDERLAEIQVRVTENTTGIDAYLKEELAALVEGIVRAYARRRLRPLLSEYEVLEVEREGSWKLADVPDVLTVGPYGNHVYGLELWFASRADALLREHSTGYLYLMSFKTTGSWDRRRAMDAEVDMQGLSEAVDVDRRLAEAWKLLHADDYFAKVGYASTLSHPSVPTINDLVSDRTAKWLLILSEPPRVLGVRYEYMLKGSRLQDKHDQDQPNRYVQNSPLCRAYKFEGVTSDERKWAHSYTVHDLSGKARNLDWRSWKKAPVWRYLSIAEWIDMLDRGDVQMDAYNAEGYAIDILADQFIPPITVYRNEDDMRDMLEQIEASETQLAIDAAAVRAVADEPFLYRSELNKRFPQSRKSCTYPGVCSYRVVCYAGAGTELREHPEQSELYQIRIPNHPVEGEEGEQACP